MLVVSAVVMARDPGDLTPKGDRDRPPEVDFAIERAVRGLSSYQDAIRRDLGRKRRGCPSYLVNSYGFSIRLTER